MKTARTLAVAFSVLVLAAIPALSRVCPVTEKPAVNDYSAEYQGQTVYFSCQLARQEFLANPAKYLDRLKHVNDDSVKLQRQSLCPVSGEKVDRSVWADYQGKRIYLHCELAKKSFLEKPETFYKKLIEEHVALDDIPMVDDRFPGASEGFKFAN